MAKMKIFLLVQIVTLLVSFKNISSLPNVEKCPYGKLNSVKKLESAATNAAHALEGFANFAIDLFKDVVKDDPSDSNNIFISPLSVWSALTATYLGANNQTATELARTLGLENMSRTDIAEAYRLLKIWYYLRTEGSKSKEKYIFQMANKLFFQDGLPMQRCVSKLLDSEIMMVNFSSSPETARSDINQWVKEQTRGKINEIVPPGFVDRSTKMILVNAAYFKGTWEMQFTKFMTDLDTFYVQPHKPISVQMMHQGEIFHVAKNEYLNCSMVELPYVGNEISMFVLLPWLGTTAERLIHNLNAKHMKHLISTMKPTSISLSLPRFDMEQASELRESLRHMGIVDLFDPIHSDLSGFTGEKEFFVSKVNHKVFINVNEKGTEAAAATSLVQLRSGIVPEEFNVNRPFVVIIRDNILDAILFVGLVRSPHE